MSSHGHGVADFNSLNSDDRLLEQLKNCISIRTFVLRKEGHARDVEKLLAVSQSNPALDMNKPIHYLFSKYSIDPKVLPKIVHYFLCKGDYPGATILLTQEEEEQFFSENIFKLISGASQAYQLDLDNWIFNNLLIDELKIKLSATGGSNESMKITFEFVKRNDIADPYIISALTEWGMKPGSLGDENILELAGLAVLSGDVVLMRKILHRYNPDPRDETTQGKSWKNFIEIILRNGKYNSKPVSEPMIGLLYGHQQGFLPDSLEFDFLISHCCHDYYHLWIVPKQQNMTADSDLRIDESSMMYPSQAAPVYEAAKKAFPGINVGVSYGELIGYIEEKLRSLGEYSGKAASKQFIPEYRYTKKVRTNAKVEQTNVEECLEDMTEQQMAIARYYTALRLLKRDPLLRGSFNPYFDDPDMGFGSMVAYCYEMAKKSGCLELLVAQLADIRRIHNMDSKEDALLAEDKPSCPQGARGRLCRTYVMSHNRQLELAREKLGLEIKKFNTGSINAVIERFVQNTLFAFRVDILKKAQVSAISEEYQHLAAIFACYQKMIAGESLSDKEKTQAEQAITYIVDKKIDYLALYQKLAQLHTEDKISECPETVKSALRAYIECQLKALFLWDEGCKNRLGAARLDSVQEGDLRWKDFPEMVVANTYPDILIHFSLMDASNFNGPMMNRVGNAAHRVSNPWYSDEEIIDLLTHYIGKHPEVAFLDPMLGTDWGDGHNTLRDNMAAYHKERGESPVGAFAKRRVIIPVNLGGGHWVLVYAIYPEDKTKAPSVYYFNSTGAPLSRNQSLNSVMRTVFPEVEIVEIVKECLQFNDDDCGPWIVAPGLWKPLAVLLTMVRYLNRAII